MIAIMIITQIFDVIFYRTRKIKIFNIFFSTCKSNELFNIYSSILNKYLKNEKKYIRENEW